MTNSKSCTRTVESLELENQLLKKRVAELEERVQQQSEEAKKALRTVAAVKLGLFSISAILALTICFHNTANAIAASFWGASHDFHHKLWKYVYDSAEGDCFTICFVYAVVSSEVVYWFGGLWYAMIDWFRPQLFHQYKVQEENIGKPVDKEKYMKLLKRVAVNSLIVQPIWTYVFFYQMYLLRGPQYGLELPSFHRILMELVVFVIVEEIGFYYSHRFFHTPYFYKRIHKIHHEWTAPVAYAAIYAHPLEHIVANLTPLMMGPLLCGSHVLTIWIWMTIALLNTMNSHSGYHFPLIPTSPEMHDFHHLKFNVNYGVLGVLDRFHDTDAKFRDSVQSKRNIVLLSTTPVSKLFPVLVKGKAE